VATAARRSRAPATDVVGANRITGDEGLFDDAGTS
jgi:hypothetical protein